MPHFEVSRHPRSIREFQEVFSLPYCNPSKIPDLRVRFEFFGGGMVPQRPLRGCLSRRGFWLGGESPLVKTALEEAICDTFVRPAFSECFRKGYDERTRKMQPLGHFFPGVRGEGTNEWEKTKSTVSGNPRDVHPKVRYDDLKTPPYRASCVRVRRHTTQTSTGGYWPSSYCVPPNILTLLHAHYGQYCTA